MGAAGGLYRPTPWGYNSNPAGRGSQPSVSQAAVLPAGFWARRLVGPADMLDTVAALLMTQARSLGRGNSAAVYRAITVAIPHPIWLMARGALGGVGRLQGGRLPQICLRGAQAAFGPPTDRRPRRLRAVQAGVVGTVRGALCLRSGQAWQQCRASPEIFQRYGSL